MSYDIFPGTALAILGALKGKTAEEMAQELLEEEEQAMRERSEEKDKYEPRASDQARQRKTQTLPWSQSCRWLVQEPWNLLDM